MAVGEGGGVVRLLTAGGTGPKLGDKAARQDEAKGERPGKGFGSEPKVGRQGRGTLSQGCACTRPCTDVRWQGSCDQPDLTWVVVFPHGVRL